MARWLDPWRPGPGQPWDVPAAAHLLRRATLGNPRRLLERCLRLAPGEAAAKLVSGELAKDHGVDAELSATLPTVLASEAPEDFAAYLWLRMLSTSHPLRARMVLFWHDHFATSVQKVRSAHWMAQQFESFENHGLGAFEQLVLEVAKGPAMLRWLDNDQNRKGQANENFARELFELFTLGRGNYSEDDIKQAARAFTGWRIRREAFYFDPRRHDSGKKTVFGKQGRFTGEQVIEMTVARPECARFVAAKLCAAFVGPGYPAGARDEVTELFRREGGRIGPVLRALLGSRVFFDPRFRGTRIRGPVEWIVWALTSLEVLAPPKLLHRAAARMGQTLLAPPDVSGWDEEEAWISSATWLSRANLAGRLGTTIELRPALEEVVPSNRELSDLARRLFPEGLGGARPGIARQALAEAGLPRSVRLNGLLRALLMLPAAHRF